MTLPRKNLRALIFDMDGTLIDTDNQHYDAYMKVLADMGISLRRDEYDSRMAGRPNMEILRDYFPDADDAQRRDIMNRKETAFRNTAATWEPLAGLAELMAWAKEQALAQALVTSAPRENAGYLLGAVNLTGVFEPEVYADELPRGKPDPLPYSTALELLGVSPEEAIVFEDSASGVKSGASAGVLTVGLATTQRPEILRAAGATLVIQDFTDPALWDLLGERPRPAAAN